MNNADLPAMPFTGKPEYQHQTSGLSKREEFAKAAMQGLAADSGGYASKGWEQRIARDAVTMASALLAELDKQEINK